MDTTAITQLDGAVGQLHEPFTFRFEVPTVRRGVEVFVPARGDNLRAVIRELLHEPERAPGPALIASWLQEYAKSANTRDAYAADIEQWVAWLYEQQVALLGAKRVHVSQWVDDLVHDVTDGGQPRYSSSTVKRKLSSVASFYRFCDHAEVIGRDPTRGVTFKGDVRNPTTALPVDAMRSLVQQARATSPVDEAIVALLYFAGLRVDELCAAARSDLTFDSGVRILRVRGKGDKTREVPAEPRSALGAPLDRHLAARERDGHRSDRLIVDEAGEPLDRHRVSYRLGQLAAAAPGVVEKVTPHRLRKSFATHAFAGGSTVEALRQALGHAEERTTRSYIEREQSWREHPMATVAEVLERDG